MNKVTETVRDWLIPAYAGSTLTLTARNKGWTAHPRLRGEHNQNVSDDIVEYGSSPLTRGAPALTIDLMQRGRLIPAYAGSTTTGGSSVRPMAAHPRLRGEHHRFVGIVYADTGSSPLTRGARERCGGVAERNRLIPAYAGSTRTCSLRCLQPWAHPRLRGEHCPPSALTESFFGSSPLTRGAQHGTGTHNTVRGLIPAYAGSTLQDAARRMRELAHPRLRGEHSPTDTSLPCRSGSSPLTRGALSSLRRFRRGYRLIPAYAGSTIRPCGIAVVDGAHPRLRGEHGLVSARPK